MTNLTDYDILVSVQSDLDKLRKDYNDLLYKNLQLKELLKRCKGLMSITKDWACTEATETLITKIDEALR